VLAAASLALPWALAFDPQAWVVWGREVLALELDTGAGPSWKPLPVLFSTPLALSGEVAPELWLVVARTGALLALAGAAALAWRLGGLVAAVAAALLLALSPWWVYNAALGNSEALLAAAVLWAAVAHLAGRTRTACMLAAAAALLRPEAWPFLLLYAAWLCRREPDQRRVVASAVAAVALLWLGPDVLGVGGAFGASHAALGDPSLDSAKRADFQALAVLVDAAEVLTLPALVAAALGVARGGRETRWLAAGAAGWVAIVALMTEAGYAGNPRYLAAAAAVGCVEAAVGVARLPRLPVPAATALLAGVALITVPDIRDGLDEVGDRAELRRGLDAVVAAGGGAAAIRVCGQPRTSGAWRAAVAWRLDVPMPGLDSLPVRPGTVLRAPPPTGGPVQPALGAEGRRLFPLRARAGGWELRASCYTRGFSKTTVTRSNPSPRIIPVSIRRVLSSARSSSSESARAASVSLRSASR
jgi:hypothetical protein